MFAGDESFFASWGGGLSVKNHQQMGLEVPLTKLSHLQEGHKDLLVLYRGCHDTTRKVLAWEFALYLFFLSTEIQDDNTKLCSFGNTLGCVLVWCINDNKPVFPVSLMKPDMLCTRQTYSLCFDWKQFVSEDLKLLYWHQMCGKVSSYTYEMTMIPKEQWNTGILCVCTPKGTENKHFCLHI